MEINESNRENTLDVSKHKKVENITYKLYYWREENKVGTINKENISDFLKSIIVCDEFNKEFLRVLKSLDDKKSFYKLLCKQKSFIDLNDKVLLQNANTNELLKSTGMDVDCYSLHLESNSFSIRILGAYYQDDFVMLCIFNERTTKYSSHIKDANVRFRNYIENRKGEKNE